MPPQDAKICRLPYLLAELFKVLGSVKGLTWKEGRNRETGGKNRKGRRQEGTKGRGQSDGREEKDEWEGGERRKGARQKARIVSARRLYGQNRCPSRNVSKSGPSRIFTN